jgi:hypothetical protein
MRLQMSGEKRRTAEKKVTVTAKDPSLHKGRLKVIGGSQSDDWNNVLANETVNALWLKHSDEKGRTRQMDGAISGLIGIGPKDELEGMLAVQLIASHSAAMESYRRGCSWSKPLKIVRRRSVRQASFPERMCCSSGR